MAVIQLDAVVDVMLDAILLLVVELSVTLNDGVLLTYYWHTQDPVLLRGAVRHAGRVMR